MCTHAYREALLRNLSSVTSPMVSPPGRRADSSRPAACRESASAVWHGGSIVEVETVQAGSRQPLMPPGSQVHREIDMPPEGSESSRMETAYRGDVASHRPDGQVLVTMGTGFLDNPGDEHAANALVP